MTDNSKERLHEVFFYGLYMDPEILKQKGVKPRNPRIASAKNFKLRIGNKATILRAPGELAHGIVYSLTHSEINSLYWGSGLNEYASESLLVNVGNEKIPALCCNLVQPPDKHESNAEYKQKLNAAMEKLGLPCATA